MTATLEDIGYRRLSEREATLLLQRVRSTCPHHPFQESGFEGMYRRRLPFYGRYLDYLVHLPPGGSWGFYASDHDVVIRFVGEGRAEFIVNRRDPISIGRMTVSAYVHHMCVGGPGYVYDPSCFALTSDTPEIHRAMIREYVTLPRFDQQDDRGVYWVKVTFYFEHDEADRPCSTLAELAIGVTPSGDLVEGQTRTLVQNLQAHRIWLL